MEPRPEPEPERRPEPRTGSSGGGAYVPKPELAKPKRAARGPLAALLLAAGLSLGALFHNAGAPQRVPRPAVTQV